MNTLQINYIANGRNTVISLVRLFSLVIINAAIFTWLSFWNIDNEYPIDKKSILITFSLGFILFISLAIFLRNYISSFIILLISLLFLLANQKKISLTGEPLIFGDISHLHHLPVALKYTSYSHLIVIFSVIILLAIYYIRKNNDKNKQPIWRYALVVGAFLFLALHSSNVVKYIGDKIRFTGVMYINWDLPLNSRVNGLIVHLIQTGNRPSPTAITEDQRKEFEDLYVEAIPSQNSPKTFIMILCESCWHDETTFREAFEPLSQEASAIFRGISPVYGGGTPNSTFEFLVALPSQNSAVGGVIYQEYRDYFSTRTSTLASILQSNGFKTWSLHNYFKSFWFRSLVEPKLGFDQFISIEDMDFQSNGEDYPSDTVLYESALKKLNGRSAYDKVFMHLATVYTHGPYYSKNDDGGTEYYEGKLRKSILDTKNFITNVREIDPEAIVILYGDHKPSLPLLDNFLTMSRHAQGDVPILLFDPNHDRAAQLKDAANNKPFYCISSSIAQQYFEITLPTSVYTDESCTFYDKENYNFSAQNVPSWVYTAALFDEENNF